MKLLVHYLKIVGKIVSSKYSFNRIQLLWCYTKLTFKSVIFHKFQSRSLTNNEEAFEVDVMGFSVKFFSYIQVITLCEEIFAFEVYKFASDGDQPFIIDCGSSIGLSLLYFKTIYPKSVIVAFEPDPQAFDLLKENVRNNGITDVTCHNMAVTNINGEVTLFKSSVSKSFGLNRIQTPHTHTVNIQSKRLSEVVIGESIDFLKIDVEGYESQILADMIETGKIRSVKQMTVEFHPTKMDDNVQNYLNKLSDIGFEFYEVKPVYPQSPDRIIYFRTKNFQPCPAVSASQVNVT